MMGVLIQRGNLDTDGHARGERCEETQGGGGEGLEEGSVYLRNAGDGQQPV